MSKAVRFDRYGGVEVLDVREVARPEPGPDQVLVAVRAAGINPSEAKIREGPAHGAEAHIDGLPVSRLRGSAVGGERELRTHLLRHEGEVLGVVAGAR